MTTNDEKVMVNCHANFKGFFLCALCCYCCITQLLAGMENGSIYFFFSMWEVDCVYGYWGNWAKRTLTLLHDDDSQPIHNFVCPCWGYLFS